MWLVFYNFLLPICNFIIELMVFNFSRANVDFKLRFVVGDCYCAVVLSFHLGNLSCPPAIFIVEYVVKVIW